MSISPIITFKVGKCDLDYSSGPPKVKAVPTPGYIYLYIEDELIHFCWRPRSAPLSEPDIDLVMIPTDATFTPYQPSKAENPQRPTNGRIFVLKFSSSSQRHLFWLQSRSQDPQSDPSHFSARDKRLGDIVNQLLQGEEIDVDSEVAALRNVRGPHDTSDDAMDDVQDTDHANEELRRGDGDGGAGSAGGAAPDQGEESREGGANGGRAPPATLSYEASTVVQNLLDSLKSSADVQSNKEGQIFTNLQDLLPPIVTVPVIESAPTNIVDSLLTHLPPEILLLAQESPSVAHPSESDATMATAEAATEALSTAQKKHILRRVLHSPQLHQSLVSLTVALREGGLRSVSDALGVPIERGSSTGQLGIPSDGEDPVEAFLRGVRRYCEQIKRADEVLKDN